MKRLSAEEVYPKSQLGKCAIYFNMSHHYRRIYSAKPRIDTNLKKTSPSLCCTSPDIFNFVRRNCMRQPLNTTPRHRICSKEEDEPKTFKPKILESRAESKLKKLSIYEPPQKIVLPKSNITEPPNTKIDVKFEDNTEEEKQLDDNTGISQTLRQIDCRDDTSEFKETKKSELEQKTPDKEGERIRPLNKCTVMFLKDITDDILQKGIYTNKSLEKLFRHHILKNKYSLPKELMEEEVARLKRELEMPMEEEKCSSESSFEDEEVLIALDSLLLPADIKDQVASSLGLKRKPPPLPSPKDSFTGSLILTSISETNDNIEDKSGMTFTLKKDPQHKTTPVDDHTVSEPLEEFILDQINLENSKNLQSDDDKTIADEEYLEEESSEPKNKSHENSQKEECAIEQNEHEEKSISSSEKNASAKEIPAAESIQEEDKEDNESAEESSNLSSIHTESV